MKTVILIGLVALAIAYEDVPQASGLEIFSKKASTNTEIRRAPVYRPSSVASDGVPRAHGLPVHRASTGVRRAPDHTVPKPNAPVRAAPAVPGQRLVARPVIRAAPNMMRLPMLPGMGVRPIPLPPLLPMMPLMQLPLAHGGPQSATPPNLLNLAGVTGLPSLPTLPTVEMPTLPTFTMPPSFQRLMGITTPATPKKKVVRHHSEEEVEDKERQEERPPKTESSEKFSQTKRVKGLSSVGSRLPKFVSETKQKAEAPEQNADWIVPF